jgi:hypothetical protein
MRHVDRLPEFGEWENTVSDVVRDWDHLLSSAIATPTPVFKGPEEIAATIKALHAAADTLHEAAEELARYLPIMGDDNACEIPGE